MVLATHTTGDPYFGWYLGLAIGFFVVVVVVGVVALLLTYATRVGDRAQEAVVALVEAREGTLGLQALRGANDSAEATLEAARARRAGPTASTPTFTASSPTPATSSPSSPTPSPSTVPFLK